MLSPRAAAILLNVSPRRVQEFIRNGRIAAENIGTVARPRYVIEETELARFAALTRPHHRPRKETRMTIPEIYAEAERRCWRELDGARADPVEVNEIIARHVRAITRDIAIQRQAEDEKRIQRA